MGSTVRRLVAGDAEASQRLGFEAFGTPESPPQAPAAVDQPGKVWFGAFEGGELVGRMADRDYHSWFGGAEVSTSGIASVTVAMEHRGRGTLSPLFDGTLRSARNRGAVISTLFPSAPRIYRRFGYELVSDYVTVQLPSQLLASAPAPESARTRRATEADVPAVRRVYDTWAAAQNGPLTRRGVSFPTTAEEYLDDFTGVTLAVDADGEVCGFASWERGRGYGKQAVLEVSDLLALTGDGYRALLQAVGSFAPVAHTTKIDTSGADVAQYFLPSSSWQVVASDPYMLAVIDVAGALLAHPYPASVRARLEFAVAGHFLADNDGAYRLEVADGVASCLRTGAADRTFSPRGLALLYAGLQSCANLRFSGLLTGGSVEEDVTWDHLFGGRQCHIRDYF